MDNNSLVAWVAEHSRKVMRSPCGPHGLDEALESAKHADPECLETIILNKSESVWLAYYVAKRAADSQHGFTDQKVIQRQFDQLSKQSIDEQQAFATQLHSAITNDSSHVMGSIAGNEPTTGTEQRCEYTLSILDCV